MANEVAWRNSATGNTVYMTIRTAAHQMWSTVGAALENMTTANWANYDIALTESPAGSYLHIGSWPAGLTTVGWYWVDVYKQAGGTAAITDDFLGSLYVYWNGTKAEPAGGDLTQWGGVAPLALSSQKVQATAVVSDKTGFSLAADQSTVTIGTVNALAAGAVGVTAIATDAITAATIKADAVTEIAAGVVANATFKKIFAACVGKVVLTGSELAFYDTDNTTVLFTHTLSDGGRTVA